MISPSVGTLMIGVMWVAGVAITLVGARFPRAPRSVFWLAILSVAGVTAFAAWLWPGTPGVAFAGGGLRLDGFSLFVQFFVLLGALCSLLLDVHSLNRKPGTAGLMLLSAAGASVLAMSWDLVGVITGFMGAMVPLWGLSVLQGGERGKEGALKGMVTGVLATALMGMGAALMFSRTGTTHFVGIQEYLRQAAWIGSDPLLVVALALLLAGVGCMVATVPFHMWFVDAVEALPNPGALLLSGGVMAAGLAAVARLLLVGFVPVAYTGPGYVSWTSVLHGVGIAALVICNALALVQQRLKRMAAYLAAGQGGLVLVTLAAAGHIAFTEPAAADQALGSILTFLAVFVVNWVGLFVAIGAVEDADGGDPGVGRLQGLANRHPWLAVAVGLALLCMAGMPMTAGFFARLYLLEAMIVAGWTGTAVVAALSLGLVLVMSLGLVAAMVIHKARAETEVRVSPALALVAFISSIAILLLGILPGGILDMAIRSAGSLLSF